MKKKKTHHTQKETTILLLTLKAEASSKNAEKIYNI